jgi:coenzyme F420 hydrogenase subunit beta
MKFKRVDQVARWRLCMGCGACVYACSHKAICLIDIRDQGLRPQVNSSRCDNCGDCIKACPGIELSNPQLNENANSELKLAWGPVLEIWEGHASDPEIRYKASSGGLATALAHYCLEKENCAGVLQTGCDPNNPLLNVPVFSKTRESLLSCTGSRYSPAAPCEKFDWITEAEGKSVLVGKPCDVAAIRKSQLANRDLNEKLGLTISIFCAGTPSTDGTYAVLDALGTKPNDVEEFRYRGCGWPGMTSAKIKNSNGDERTMTYQQSWGTILCNHTQFRCRICPDSTGEFADISCGDPWYKEIDPVDKGQSLILVRTEKGRKILHKAIDSGYISVKKVKSCTLPQSQKSVYNKRLHLFGRLLAMKLIFIPIPKYIGFGLLSNWLTLSLSERLRSIFGTLRRGVTRGWMLPVRSNKSDIATRQ